MNTRQYIQKMIKTYPLAKAVDLIKLITELAFGSSQVQTKTKANAYTLADITILNKHYAKVTLLKKTNNAISRKTLDAIAFHSSSTDEDRHMLFDLLHTTLNQVLLKGHHHVTPIMIDEIISKGFKQPHQTQSTFSQTFMKTYHRDYIIMDLKWLPMLDVFIKLDHLHIEKPHVLLAIDGNSSSGKTTFSTFLNAVYNGNLIHMDDFFNNPNQVSTSSRDHANNIDFERLKKEIIEPVQKRHTLTYRAYDCQSDTFKPPIEMTSKPWTIIEGAYSMHPIVYAHYDFCIFFKTSRLQQMKRIWKRNGHQKLRVFLKRWIPSENRYFKAYDIKKKANLIIKT
ncbi:MAG: hypothetical protein IH571_05860 [Acholeplasmataceae bacterium]|nr:hypothetical protein [Acholeplasmataceae bacterium]